MSQSTKIEIPAVETEFVVIPNTQLKVSRVALGTWAIGGWMWGGTDQRESIATIHAALHQGINLIDTAPAYGFGVSEEIVGAALVGVRAEAVIATKAGLEWRDGKIYRNASRARIMQEIDDSLRRLRTDYIDIYQVHWPDPLVPMEETAEAMRTLLRAREDPCNRRQQFLGRADGALPPCRAAARAAVALQSVRARHRGARSCRYCRANNIATLGYGALCRGLLSGRMRPTPLSAATICGVSTQSSSRPALRSTSTPSGSSMSSRSAVFQRRVIQLAVRWVLDQGISVALWGGRHPGSTGSRARCGRLVARRRRPRANRSHRECAVTDPVGPEFMAPPQRS